MLYTRHYDEEDETDGDIPEKKLFPAVLAEHLIVLGDPYGWCDKPRIRFSLRGIDLGRGIIKIKDSLFDGRYPIDSFFNAEIHLPDLNEDIIRFSGVSPEELIIYARYLFMVIINVKPVFLVLLN